MMWQNTAHETFRRAIWTVVSAARLRTTGQSCADIDRYYLMETLMDFSQRNDLLQELDNLINRQLRSLGIKTHRAGMMGMTPSAESDMQAFEAACLRAAEISAELRANPVD